MKASSTAQTSRSGLKDLIPFSQKLFHVKQYDPELVETVEVEVKYQGYIDIQKEEIARLKKLQKTQIPDGFNYEGVFGLSYELKEKLTENKPQTLAEAARISGMTPAALTALLGSLHANRSQNQA